MTSFLRKLLVGCLIVIPLLFGLAFATLHLTSKPLKEIYEDEVQLIRRHMNVPPVTIDVRGLSQKELQRRYPSFDGKRATIDGVPYVLDPKAKMLLRVDSQ